jgi:hypothetical protein
MFWVSDLFADATARAAVIIEKHDHAGKLTDHMDELDYVWKLLNAAESGA